MQQKPANTGKILIVNKLPKTSRHTSCGCLSNNIIIVMRKELAETQ